MPSTLAASTSIPTTVNPPRANSQARGRPTYPMPITATVARRLLSFPTSAPAASPTGETAPGATATDAPPSGGRAGLGPAGRRALSAFVLPTRILLTLAFLGALLAVMPD